MGIYNLEIMSNKKIAIVDCNNFYVSCERLFNPKIRKKPTVVLSNNDGCIIARSPEIKKLGVRMGQHLFNLDETIKTQMVKFSSNYVLYGDISDRIANILKRFTPRTEVYSIDESFMDLSHIPTNELVGYMRLIKEEVFKLTGIPVSIGVAPNKTLAKLMNYQAKTILSLEGICSYYEEDPESINAISIGEVWGIGSKWTQKLDAMGVSSIGQFKMLPSYHVRKLVTIVGLRTWMELQGDYVYAVDAEFKKPKIVTSSRSFGRQVWDKKQVADALCTFIDDACSKLTKEQLKSKKCVVFVTTDRFKPNYKVWSQRVTLFTPSNLTQSIWNEVAPHLENLPQRLWAKAGVIFTDLINEKIEIKTLFHESYACQEIPKLDYQAWMTRREFLSPKWTTDWQEIPRVSYGD